MKAPLIAAVVLGFVFGILFGVATGLFRLSEASPAALTSAQAERVIAVNRDINRRFAHFDRRGHGLCGWLAQLKVWALERAGVPASAMRFQDVRAPAGWSDPEHRLVQINAVVDGRPWKVALDMNSPWPLDGPAEWAMGYRPLRPASTGPALGFAR